MSDPSFRSQARVHLSQAMHNVSVMENMCGALHGHFQGDVVEGLRSALHEAYGHLGNLLAEAAPWRDRHVPMNPAVQVPEEPEESEEEDDVAAAAGS